MSPKEMPSNAPEPSRAAKIPPASKPPSRPPPSPPKKPDFLVVEPAAAAVPPAEPVAATE